jgi:hypothetical protein
VLQQRLDAGDVSVRGGGVKRRPAAGLTEIGPGAGLDEQPNDVGVGGGGGRVKGRAGHETAAERIDLGASSDQQRRGFGSAEERREVQRREAVARVARHEGRLRIEEHREAIEIAERRGFEHVELGDAILDRIDESEVHPVSGAHQRRDPVVIARVRERGILRHDPTNLLHVVGLDRLEQLLPGACHGFPPAYHLCRLTKYP